MPTPTLSAVDTKLSQVLKEVKQIRAAIKRLDIALSALDEPGDAAGMTYYVGSEIKQKLDEILERLPS